MPIYRPPLRDMRFVVHEVFDVTDVLRPDPSQTRLDRETFDAVLDEAARFAADVVFPLNRPGDEQGCRLDLATHEVTAPSGFKAAYRHLVEGGWPSLCCDPAYGGQGLPYVLNQCVLEMFNSASQAWTMYAALSHGAYEALHAFGTEAQKALYLPRLTSGAWTGTMCLTEPHCGTDLGLLRTKAVPGDDGTWRLSGEKIFISAGEHDLAENIVHLVLARLPDAPAGSKGLSLFVVPKFLVAADGSAGARNGIHCGSLEHKMGLHGNATARLVLEGAVGELVGEPHRGLSSMFVMMNAARLGVGIQSLGLSEVAYQNAAAYARDRLQMRSLSGVKAPDRPADPIIVHPDVRRLLLTARAYAEGGRALVAWTALLLDRSSTAESADDRRECAELVSLLTPIVKAFLTDNGLVATSHCLQVLGGHGYIREWGMEQFVRDARVNTIYEGTNAIQSLDLLGRKVLADGGARIKALGRIIEQFIDDEGTDEAMQEFIDPLADLGAKVVKLTTEIGLKTMGDRDELGAASVDYLRVCGHLLFTYLFARMAKVALAKVDGGDPFYAAKLATARFYVAKLLPETAMLIRSARAGAGPLMAMDEAQF